MQEQRYQGGCQCRAVSYEVTANLDQVVTCNCSRCKPMGFVLAFVKDSDFELKSGMDYMTEYKFNTGSIQHLFCSTCGVESFAYGNMPDGTKTVAINVNCLDGVDPRALAATPVDGKSA